MVAPAWLTGSVYAHRGLHDDRISENSLPSFEAAIAAGHGIECDVQASGDGVAMLFHDWTLDRLTSETGPLRKRRATDLQAIALGRSGKIATLEQAMDLVAGRAPVLIELKSRRRSSWKALARSVAAVLAGYRGEAAVMSFDPRIVRWFATALPHHPRGLVTGRHAAGRFAFTARRTLAIAHVAPDFLACDLRDLPDADLAARRRRGMPLLGWTARDAASRSAANTYCDAPIAEGAGF